MLLKWGNTNMKGKPQLRWWLLNVRMGRRPESGTITSTITKYLGGENCYRKNDLTQI
jgi:hypothetical protein